MAGRRRTIAFVGNCQAQVLSAVYRRRVATLLNEDVIDIRAPLTNAELEAPAMLAALEQADVVVEQKFDSPDAIPAGFFAGRAARHVRFPYVTGRFYWPYGGVLHPHYVEPPEQPAFPFVAEQGDSFLNQMMLEAVPAEEALRRYDAAVADGAARIRRLAELHLERQRERDAACDMHFAGLIAASYRDEALFSTQGHPNLRITRLLVEQVLTAIGVPYSLVDGTVRWLRASVFPRSELPIHPGVAEILGLTFVAPGQRYRFQREGEFTFEEYARRYLAGTWEPDLERGLVRLHAGDPEAAARLMQASLRRCPGTGTAWRLLALVLSQTGREQAADEAIAIAIERDPEDADVYGTLSNILARRREFAAAEAAARRAIGLSPFGIVGHRALAEALSRQHRHPEAVAVARVAAATDPGHPRALATLAHHLMMAREWREAAETLRRALAMNPTDAPMQKRLAEAESWLAKTAAKAA